MPEMYLFGGPNGAGKTTFARQILPALGCKEFVNADAIAAALSPFQPDSVALQAGYILMKRLRDLVKQGVDFGTESTLSARAWVPFLKECRARGYNVNVIYVWLSSPELAVARVAARVRSGGHDIPEATIRRRYDRSLQNFFSLYLAMAEAWQVYDNSDNRPVLVAAGKKHGRHEIYDPCRWSRISQEVTVVELAEKCERSVRLEKLAQAAIANAIEEHRRMGRSIAVWRDGQVIAVPPEAIPVHSMTAIEPNKK